MSTEIDDDWVISSEVKNDPNATCINYTERSPKIENINSIKSTTQRFNTSTREKSPVPTSRPLSVHSAPFTPMSQLQQQQQQQQQSVIHQISDTKLSSKWSQPRPPKTVSRRFASLAAEAAATSPLPSPPPLQHQVTPSPVITANETFYPSSTSAQLKVKSQQYISQPQLNQSTGNKTSLSQTTAVTSAQRKGSIENMANEVTADHINPSQKQTVSSQVEEGLDVAITQQLCRTMSAEEFVKQILRTYKSVEYYKYLSENSKYPPLHKQISDNLHLCPDPCAWIQCVLLEIASLFTNNKQNRYFKPKFQRILVQAICHGLQTFLDIPAEKRKTSDELIAEKEKKEEPQQPMYDLISFSDDEEGDTTEEDLIDLGNNFNSLNIQSAKQPAQYQSNDNKDKNININNNNAIVTDTTSNNNKNNNNKRISIFKEFDLIFGANNKENNNKDSNNNENKNENNNENIEDNNAPREEASDTKQSEEIQSRYTLRYEHQVDYIKMIRQVGSPSVIYYSLDVFNLSPLLTVGGEYEQEGTFLCRQLLHQGFYNEAISCIQKLQQYKNFPLATFADYMFGVGQGGLLAVYAKDKVHLQRGLLSYINIQLRYNFAGDLGIVDKAYLQDIEETKKTTPPLNSMKERKFQKELVTCSSKIMDQLEDSVNNDNYYFILLSQRYMSLRWILSSRSQQQATYNDYSIDGSSNYNGLLEYLIEQSDDDALTKLLIKELVDVHDLLAADYFSTLLRQESFYHFYKSLPLDKRMLGIIKGEQLSYARPSNPKKSISSTGLYYSLPTDANWTMVDDDASLNNMDQILELSKICGLDTEWLPSFAKSGKVKTALMQIATDLKIVFLVDFKVLCSPSNTNLLDKAEKILRRLFESKHIIKLAYEFGGDLSLLQYSVPQIKEWKITNMMDLKLIRHYDAINKRLGNLVTGGLAGVVSTYLGVSVNKKQQISNWEKRPLTHEQVIYAACDSYCLLEIYQVLVAQNHPFIQNATKTPLNTPLSTSSDSTNSLISTSSSTVPSIPNKDLLNSTGVLETPTSNPVGFSLI